MNALKLFRGISLLEGLSYLILVFIAMPLKYGFDLPLMVRIVGAAHGFLFVLFVIALALATRSARWKPVRPLLYFVASLFPFGFIYIERQLRAQTSNPSEQTNAAV